MREKYQVTGRQVSAARALLGMPQDELAREAGISLSTLRRFEAMTGPLEGLASNVEAVRSALEAKGVEFLDHGSPGVRIKSKGARR